MEAAAQLARLLAQPRPAVCGTVLAVDACPTVLPPAVVAFTAPAKAARHGSLATTPRAAAASTTAAAAAKAAGGAAAALLHARKVGDQTRRGALDLALIDVVEQVAVLTQEIPQGILRRRHIRRR